MNYYLRNDFLTATISSLGAELISMKDAENIEYIWDANETYWKRHTPILFPKVGRMKNNTYTLNGNTYSLPGHGFARDMEFTIEKETTDSITFVLTSSMETHTLYPYDFTLKVIYTLEENSLAIAYEVINNSSDTMSFSIGAHPGFMCPFFPNETMEDYYISFEKEENALQMILGKEGFFTHETAPFLGSTLALSPEAFIEDAIALKNLKSTSVSLCSKNHNKKLTVSFPGFPFLGIWSLPNRAPFVCIEPWFGHGDFEEDSTDFDKKEDHLLLESGHTFSCVHTMTIS